MGDWTSLSGSQRAALTDKVYDRDGGVCHICRLHVRREDASLDHLVPQSRGGVSVEENLALAHRRCNYSRGDKALPSADAGLIHDGLAWFTAEE